MAKRPIRPAKLCRSWLFLEGANEAALRAAPKSGADVLIQELEGGEELRQFKRGS